MSPAPLISLAVICLLTGGLCCRLYRKLARQRRLQAILNLERDAALRCLRDMAAAEHSRNFSTALDEAQLKTRLNMSGAAANTAAKYRHAVSLANYGLNAEAIAAVLEISPREAEQVLSLAFAAHNSAENKTKEKPAAGRKK